MKFFQKALTLLWILSPISQAADLYGTTGRGDTPSILYKIDRATGSQTLVGPVLVGGMDSVTVDGMAWDKRNAVMLAHTSIHSPPWATDNSLIEVSLVDGRATLLSTTDIPPLPPPPPPPYDDATGLCVDSQGQPYSWYEHTFPNLPHDDLIKLNKITGVALVVGNSGISTQDNFGMAFDRSDDTKIHFINGDGSYFLVDTATGKGTFQNTMVALSFWGQEGDIDPDAPALTYWSVEYEENGPNVNSRLQKFLLPSGAAVGTPVQTNLNDLATIAFTAAKDTSGPVIPAQCPTCTTRFGATGELVHKHFFLLGCFDKCTVLPQLKKNLNWQCGKCI